jgi:2-keto-4-pentenoate hydratase/2-oxohepta-3-ene-1,7-dioic acid hydratase in catechol pathway
MQLGMLRSGDFGIVRGDRLIVVSPGDLEGGPRSVGELIEGYEHHRARLDAADGGASSSFSTSSFDAPLRTPTKIWAAASNFVRGTGEVGAGVGRGEAPTANPEQILQMAFLKPPSAIVGPGESIVIPAGAGEIFPEVELCIVIGRRCRDVPVEEALDVVFGYTIMLDITARSRGASENGRATRCVRKGYDTFAPLGPWITTREEVRDPQDLTLRLAVNGADRQEASTRGMINGVAQLVSYLSGVATLEVGDLIATGNPDHPAFQQALLPGDEVRAEISGMGSMTLGVVAA